MGKIFVTSRSAVFNGDPYQHTNLTYDADGDQNTKGDQQVIRGGSDTGLSGPYYIEAGRLADKSRDDLVDRDPYKDNNFTTVYNGVDAESIWNQMVNAAKSLGKEAADPNHLYQGQKVIVPDFEYDLSQNACNTLTSTILSMTGFGTLSQNVPRLGGDTGNGDSLGGWRFPGADSRLNTSGGGNTVVTSAMNSVLDQGGDDTYIINGANNRNSPVYIIEDNNSGSADKIVIQNVRPEDIRFTKTSQGDLKIYFPGDDNPDIVIPRQYDGSGIPKINALWITPPGGGDPYVLPLNNPDGFPNLFTPIHSLSPWIPLALDPYQGAFRAGSGGGGYDPLVLDLGSAGIVYTSLRPAGSATGYGPGAVYWDGNNDGFREASGWVGPEDGLLCMDRNGNGAICVKKYICCVLGNSLPDVSL